MTSVIVLGACAPTPLGEHGAGHASTAACTSQPFPGDVRREALGSSERFLVAARQASADTTRSTTLGRITDSAGWSNGWDPMVQREDWMTPANPDRLAGTSGMYWTYAAVDPDSSSHSGDYIFLRGNEPIQTVPYSVDDMPVAAEYGASPIIRRDQLLRRGESSTPVLVPTP